MNETQDSSSYTFMPIIVVCRPYWSVTKYEPKILINKDTEYYRYYYKDLGFRMIIQWKKYPNMW